VLQENHPRKLQTMQAIVQTAQRVNHLLQAELAPIALLVHIILTAVIYARIALPIQDRVLRQHLVYYVRLGHSQTQVLKHVQIAMRVSLP